MRVVFFGLVIAVFMVSVVLTPAWANDPSEGLVACWAIDDGGNGHYYEVVNSGSLTWTEAKEQAEAMSYNGMSGYLATLTSSEENTFVVNAFGAATTEHWLGGYQDITAQGYYEPGVSWKWITGERWDYTHWGHNQPDNWVDGTEHFLNLLAFDHTKDRLDLPALAIAISIES